MEEKKKAFSRASSKVSQRPEENIVSGMDSIFSGFSAIDDDFYEELEETLIMGDMGIQTTMAVIEDLKKNVKEQHIKDPEQCREALIASIRSKMDLGENAYEFEHRKIRCSCHRCQRCRKDHIHRKACGPVKGRGKESRPRRS